MTLGKIFNNIKSARKCYLEKIMGVLTQCIDVQEVDKEIYKLKVQGFLETECTDYHPFYCRKTKNSEPEKIKLKDLKKGYYVGSHINTKSENTYNLSDEDCWILGRYIADGHIRKDKRKNRKNSYQYQCILSIGSNKVDELKDIVKNRH